ncbi:hypothetical protein NDK47_21300 [Brevibacillus ruminantium]|uniref:Peptidase S24/S26A/S26B/S26C domain-containing protein n=1 Tax=Brevibacillus ruminantium TaxID=2950604 RepID=A0ABY4WH50_9BACL|nr:hypothetical protein [Brevibacillus ruminantium]USG64654.1 hypothetical protein NDK47_21300 [Brevibacillus ruminantium]
MKKVFLAGDAFSSHFFDLSLDEEELSLMSWIPIASYHVARFALIMRDNGLQGLGISPGDGLLISDYSLEPIIGRPVMVRQEGQYIIRVATEVNPVECVFSCTDDHPPLILPSENIRIVGVVSGIISQPKIHQG